MSVDLPGRDGVALGGRLLGYLGTLHSQGLVGEETFSRGLVAAWSSMDQLLRSVGMTPLEIEALLSLVLGVATGIGQALAEQNLAGVTARTKKAG